MRRRLVILMTATAVGCGSPPTPKSFQVTAPTPFTPRETLATTNLPDGMQVNATLLTARGNPKETFGAVAKNGRLSLLTNLDPGTYEFLFRVQSCLPLKREVRQGVSVTLQHLGFVYGDIDQDGSITERDLAHLRRWHRRDVWSAPSPVDREAHVRADLADWDGNGRIDEFEIILARSNLGK